MNGFPFTALVRMFVWLCVPPGNDGAYNVVSADDGSGNDSTIFDHLFYYTTDEETSAREKAD